VTISWPTALRGAFRYGALAQSTVAALLVGSTLFVVNLLAQVREGPVTPGLLTRVGLTFLVPWLNATIGIAIGLRKSSVPPRPVQPAPN
jgi:hypothetical protein